MDFLLNILHLCEEGTTQLGPGLRYGIWVQGCPFNCKGCATPEGIPIAPNKLIKLESIYLSVINNQKITGITLSGGEPFLQASKLSLLMKAILKERPELDVIVYTGFKKCQLDWKEALELLNYVDVLIDGNYIKKYDNNRGLRGSSNQQIHYLTDRLYSYKLYFESRERSIDVFVEQGQAIWIGIPNRDIKIQKLFLMSSEFKTTSHWQTEQHLIAFDRRISNQQRDLIDRTTKLKNNLSRQISNSIDSLRNETIAREQNIIASLKQDTQNKISALELQQREAMLRQADHFYDIVNQQSQSFSEQLNAQSLSLQNQIRSSHEILSAALNDQANTLNARINETNVFVNQIVEQVNKNFELQQKQINAVTNQVNEIIEREQNHQLRALMHLEHCQALMNIARSDLAVQKFAPEQFNELLQAFQNLPTMEDGPQAISAQASNLRQQILKVQSNAKKEQLAFDIIHTATLAHAESLLEIMRQNREETYFRDENDQVIISEEDQGIRVEIDYWTDGAYSEIEREVKQLRDDLKEFKDESSLTQKRVEYILAQLRSLEVRQADLITTAACKGMLSEERVVVSEQIISALYKSGFELKKDYTGALAHNYLGNSEKGTEADMREGVYAVLKRGEVEITVLVNPDMTERKNQIVFQRNDENTDNPEELRHIIQKIRNSIELETGSKLGPESAPATIGDQKVTELADIEALRKGMSKGLKVRLAGGK